MYLRLRVDRSDLVAHLRSEGADSGKLAQQSGLGIPYSAIADAFYQTAGGWFRAVKPKQRVQTHQSPRPRRKGQPAAPVLLQMEDISKGSEAHDAMHSPSSGCRCRTAAGAELRFSTGAADDPHIRNSAVHTQSAERCVLPLPARLRPGTERTPLPDALAQLSPSTWHRTIYPPHCRKEAEVRLGTCMIRSDFKVVKPV